MVHLMLDQWRKKLVESQLTPELVEKIDQAVNRRINSAGFDPWGLDPETVKNVVAAMLPVYRKYFRVDSVGAEKIPEGRVLLVSNHGGQIPLDGFIIGMSLIVDAPKPRIVRGMFERWATHLPFVGSFFGKLGQVVGDQRNCLDLLSREEAVLVFPEGVQACGKTVQHRYELMRFGSGFMRLALEAGTPIIPVAVIGCEEAYPSLLNIKPLAKLLSAPYVPITPLFPFLGPLGLIPLPTRISVRFGEPLRFEGDPDAPDTEIDLKVERVRAAVQAELSEGLRLRGDRLFTGSGAHAEATVETDTANTEVVETTEEKVIPGDGKN